MRTRSGGVACQRRAVPGGLPDQVTPADAGVGVRRPNVGTSALTAAVGLIAGAILGRLIDSVLNSQLHLWEATLALVCIAAVGITAVSLSAARTATESNRELARAFEATATATRRSLTELGQNLGLRVRSQMLTDANRHEAPEDDLVVQAFRAARQEILVLDRLSSSGERPDVTMDDRVMTWHLDAILERARDHVSYTRYVQVDDVREPFGALRPTSATQRVNPFAVHCVAMSQLRASDQARVLLKVCPTIFPYKFVIIDSTTLVLQLHEVDGALDGDDSPRTICELVIDDPHRELIRHFADMWRKVDAHRDIRTITATSQDFAALQAAARPSPENLPSPT
jgi:hypothetical protein